MGELVLMLLLTCADCGGIPALAFTYINGIIKFSGYRLNSASHNNLIDNVHIIGQVI